MQGTVTISLENYEKLKESHKESQKIKDDMLVTMKELQVFLSYLCGREDISKYIEEFNRQSKTSTIVIQNGRAQIKFNEEV